MRRLIELVDDITRVSKLFNLGIVLVLCLVILRTDDFWTELAMCFVFISRSAIRVFRRV